MPNPEKTYARVSAGVAVLAFGLIFLPGLIELDGMRGGYALSFVALVIAVSAAVLTWFFWGRATMLDRLLAGGVCWRIGLISPMNGNAMLRLNCKNKRWEINGCSW